MSGDFGMDVDASWLPPAHREQLEWMVHAVKTFQLVDVESNQAMVDAFRSMRPRMVEEHPETFDRHEFEALIERMQAIVDAARTIQEAGGGE